MSPGGKRSSTDTPGPTDRIGGPIARTLLIVLAASFPFEIPILTLGPLTITTVELMLYLLLAAWGLGLMAHAATIVSARSRWEWARATMTAATRDPIARAAVVWLAIIFVSAFAAPTQRVPALKFALRAFGGGLLFFAARGLMRSPADNRTVILAILTGAVSSAVGAVAEIAFPETAALWHPFRQGNFTVTGLPRPSGPFGYPTTAAMYWEAALPLVIVLAMSKPDERASVGRRERGWTAAALPLALLGATTLVTAIFCSATRSALAVSALGSGVMLALTWQRGWRARLMTGGTFILIVLLAGTALASRSGESPLAMRLRWWNDGAWYRARYTVATPHITIAAGSLTEVPITVENTGGLLWHHAGPNAVYLSYHWQKTDALGTHLAFEGRRSPLPADVPPGNSTRVLGTLRAPDQPGRYKVRWDLVRENVTWFSARGVATVDQSVEVVPAGPRAPRAPPSAMIDSTLEEWVLSETPTRPDLWRAAVRLWRHHPLWGVGPDNFRLLYPQEIYPKPKKAPASYDTRTHANSLYFETLADLGLAGIVALALLMAAVFRGAWPQLFWGRSPPIAAACAVAAGTFFVHGLLDYFLEFTPTYGLFWLLLALGAAASSPGHPVPAPAPATSRE